MHPEMKPVMQRTLIVTGGPLATAVGAHYRRLLSQRGGPAAAIAVVAHEAAASVAELASDLQSALTAISPPTLATTLAQQGWRLAAAAEVALFLLLDTAVFDGIQAEALRQATAAMMQQHLNVDAPAALIWLAGDPHDEATRRSLSAPVDDRPTFARGVFALAPLNESGLRLPDEETLVETAAELTWALTATPLRLVPDWMQAENVPAVGVSRALYSVGMGCWRWSRGQTRRHFVGRWVRAVLSHWLRAAEADVEAAGVEQWLAYRRLDDEALRAYLRAARPAEPPVVDTAWQAPAPWQIARLWAELRAEADAARERRKALEDDLRWHLSAWLDEAAVTLRDFLQARLDEQPVGGVAAVCEWSVTLLAVLDRVCGALAAQVEQEAERGAVLAEQRGVLAGRMRDLLARWPASPAAWVGVGLRPWRWPRLGWRYWRLRQTGQALAQLTRQQQVQGRRTVVLDTSRRGMATLHKEVRHLHSQVDEIGEMLRYLDEQLAMNNEQSTDNGPRITVPWALYEQLVSDEREEAEAAAAAIGGLGRQLTALDDAVVESLRRLAQERLAGLEEMTAVDALAALCDGESEWQMWWEALWQQAAPLWRYDETRLRETERQRQRQRAWVCSRDGQRLAAQLQDVVDLPQDVRWVEGRDAEQIVLLRLRSGLTAAAMAAAAEVMEEE